MYAHKYTRTLKKSGSRDTESTQVGVVWDGQGQNQTQMKLKSTHTVFRSSVAFVVLMWFYRVSVWVNYVWYFGIPLNLWAFYIFNACKVYTCTYSYWMVTAHHIFHLPSFMWSVCVFPWTKVFLITHLPEHTHIRTFKHTPAAEEGKKNSLTKWHYMFYTVDVIKAANFSKYGW